MTILSLLGAGLVDFVGKSVGDIAHAVLGGCGNSCSNGCAAATSGVTYGLGISTYVDVPTRVHKGRVPCRSATPAPTTTIVCNCNCNCGRGGCCSSTSTCSANSSSSNSSVRPCGCRG